MWKTVFFDVDTQLDFLYPAGALYVPGAEEIVPVLAKLTRFAAGQKILLISTADAHAEDDPEFKVWKPHCVAGTTGQQKAAATLLPNALVMGSTKGCFREFEKQSAPAAQIIIEKQKLDAFSNPNLQLLLGAIRADRYVVYGVVTELCVRCAALGLLGTGARVEIVRDAIKNLNADDDRNFIDEFRAQGGNLTTTASLLSE
jgi:nicotinamidase/pyrazinamidase